MTKDAATLQGTVQQQFLEPTLVPELAVSDFNISLDFWVKLLGFTVKYQRPAEGFAYLVCGSSQVMLDQIGLTRTWKTSPLKYPLGRGINFQILEPILQRLAAAGHQLYMLPEEKWYETETGKVGVKQFLVQDPDGYLLRFSQHLQERPPETDV